MEIDKESVEEVISTMKNMFDADLYKRSEKELEDFWFFDWNDFISIEQNTEQFFDLLEMYKSFCMQWEEHFNGSDCIDERVRTKYIMPKIKEFVKQIKEKN